MTSLWSSASQLIYIWSNQLGNIAISYVSGSFCLHKLQTCSPNSIPAASAASFPHTFLHALVLGDGCGAADSTDPVMRLSSCSKRGLFVSHPHPESQVQCNVEFKP